MNKIKCVEEYIENNLYGFAMESELLYGTWYMNGNDGTDFDWSMNGRTPEFMRFYESSEYGAIKVFVTSDGYIRGYRYSDRGHGTPEKLDAEFIGEDRAEDIYMYLLKNADWENKYDEEVNDITKGK